MGRRANHLARPLVVTLRRPWAIVAAVALIVGGTLALVLLLTSHSPQVVPQRAVSAEGSVSRSGILFADPLRATVEVLVDRRRVDPARVGFSTNFEPFGRVGIPKVTRSDAGRLTRLIYTANLVCSTDACLPRKTGRMRIHFRPAQVFYFSRDGSARRAVDVTWQPLTLSGRTSNADLAGGNPFERPPWRATTDPLAMSYRVSPTLLKGIFLVVSALLFLGAAFALARLLQAIQARVRIPLPSSLERAVRQVERTESRDDAAAKRKALELLSRELARSGESQLALAARELAWAEPTPIPAATQPLTLDVRRLIEQRSNGHAA
jgi:hypothetical protein